MASFDCSAEGMAALGDWLAERVGVAIQKGMHSAALKTVQHIQIVLIPRAKPHMPVDRGIYRAAWIVMISQGGNAFAPIFIINTAPHAGIIEYGVRAANVKPGRSMLNALSEWVQRKGLNARTSTKPTGGDKSEKPEVVPTPEKPKNQSASLIKALVKALAKFIKWKKVGAKTAKDGPLTILVAPTDTEAMGIAWAIALSMKEKGIFEGKGLRIAEKAAPKLREFTEKEVAREITRMFG